MKKTLKKLTLAMSMIPVVAPAAFVMSCSKKTESEVETEIPAEFNTYKDWIELFESQASFERFTSSKTGNDLNSLKSNTDKIDFSYAMGFEELFVQTGGLDFREFDWDKIDGYVSGEDWFVSDQFDFPYKIDVEVDSFGYTYDTREIQGSLWINVSFIDEDETDDEVPPENEDYYIHFSLVGSDGNIDFLTLYDELADKNIVSQLSNFHLPNENDFDKTKYYPESEVERLFGFPIDTNLGENFTYKITTYRMNTSVSKAYSFKFYAYYKEDLTASGNGTSVGSISLTLKASDINVED